MKYKYFFLTVISLIFFSGITAFVYTKVSSQDRLILRLNSSKESYKLGEVLEFSFELKNNGDKEIQILDIFGTGTGFLHLLCSKNGKAFIGCSDPSWGTLDSEGLIRLEPTQSVTSSSTILWDWRKQDVPIFMFAEPETYFVKAKYNYSLKGENGEPFIKNEKGEAVYFSVESKAIKITLEEPKGEDLEIWSKIKNNGNFAYFMQKGDSLIPTYKPEERAKFQADVETIICQFPNSIYAQPLQRSLNTFKANEAKRQAIIEKMKANSVPKP
jgi:hypothetical protein